MTTTRYGLAGLGPISQAQTSGFTSGAYNQGTAPPELNTENYSGVYRGSLSSQGNMVAMQLNTGAYTTPTATPYLTGYFRNYWKDPTACTFGANSAIPAITGVIPSAINDMQGNFLYYLDLQLTRTTGSNYFNTNYFLNIFAQAVGWVSSSNSYIIPLNKAETTNLEYYGYDSYQSWITQGLNQYKIGQALTIAFRNVGLNLQTVADGENCFATPNAVAKTMIQYGLGYIGDLTNNLVRAGVNFSDIYNEDFSLIIAEQLSKITNPADLATIQDVLSSSIPNIRSPLDYCSIESASGLQNDSIFQTFKDAGNDLFQRTSTFTLQNGKEFAALLDALQTSVSAEVEELATPNSLLPPEVIEDLTRILPIGINQQPITVLNVIGTASGYYTFELQELNRHIALLNNSTFGPLIRNSLMLISKYASESDPLLNTEINNYYSLLNAAALNPVTGDMVAVINQLYLNICLKLREEYLNYNKANFEVISYGDNSQVLGFVSSLAGYAQDSSGINTAYALYKMSSENVAGGCVKAVIEQYQNSKLLANAGVRVTSLI